MKNQKIKTEWNLKLLYKGDNDPQIEKDIKDIEKICSDFEKKYKGKDFTSSAQKILKAIKDYEVLKDKISGNKPSFYFKLKADLDSNNQKVKAIGTKNDQRITQIRNKLSFFTLTIGKIPSSKQKVFLKDKSLSSYKYFLIRIFNEAKFYLPEGEEQLSNLLSQPGYELWVEATQYAVTNQTVSHKEEKMPLSKASSILSDLPKKERHELHNKINQSLKEVSKIAEAEINAIFNFKKIMDERRGFQKSYEETILGYENDLKGIEMLVNLITRNFKISKKFYLLHARLLKEKKLSYADRSVKIGKISAKFDFDTSVKMLIESLDKVDPEYTKILKNYLDKGQIDVYPKKGKRGGAYCAGSGKLPTFVLLNHTNDIRSLETLAHEMGHSFHTELSKNQPPLSRSYPISSAEVASTFFEQIMGEEIEKHLNDEEKITMLHNKISGDIATIFRQIACFNFETELHSSIRKEGQVSAEVMAGLMSKHLQSYLGDAVNVTKDDGYAFVNWPHIRGFFYVYTYAYGQIISKALFANYKKDPSYAKKVKQFLSAGKSMSPEDIFKSIGIDTSKPAFFEAGLKAIEADIAKLEKLANLQFI